MIQLRLFYLNVPHYNLVGDFYYKYNQLYEDNSVAYVGYHCNKTGHTLSDKTLEEMLKNEC